jgi:hypothetical protein
MSSKCVDCGKVNSFEARFCQACGTKLEGLPVTAMLYGKTIILTLYGAFVAFLAGILGVGASIYYAQRYYFGEICATLFLISLFGFVSFAFSAFGMISTAMKNRRSKRS